MDQDQNNNLNEEQTSPFDTINNSVEPEVSPFDTAGAPVHPEATPVNNTADMGQQQVYTAPVNPVSAYTPPVVDPNMMNAAPAQNTLGLVSLICGIVGAVFVFTRLSGLGLLLAIAAIITGALGKKQQPSGQATAGMIIGIIVVALFILLVVVVAACLSTAMLASGLY